MIEEDEIFEPYQGDETFGIEALNELTGGKGEDEDAE